MTRRDYVVVPKGAKQATADQWRNVALGDVCTKIGSGATPRGGKDVYLDEGLYTLIRSQNVYNDGFRREGLAFISDHHADELRSVEVFEDDVLLNITGDSVARACQVAPDVLPSRVNQHVAIIRPDAINLDSGYLRYYLVSSEMQTVLLSWAGSGGTRNALTKGMIESLEVTLPPLSQQRTIAHILGTLDDKIELNRQINETLEEMARALFRSWFVDFDPVRAKAALKRSSLITPPLRGSRQAKGVSPQARRWGDIKRRYSPQTLRKARTLRQAGTDAEGLLWHFLRNKQLDDCKFRRQQPIGPYIADFACLSRKLLIELDGSQHAERHVYDEKRDNFLQEKGYRILRFWNNEVFEHCFGVLEQMYEALTSPPPHQPSPVGSASACLSCGRRQATPPRGGSDWSIERARAYLPAARGLAQAGLDGMDDSIVDLFPDRLVDSEIGEIPEGWEVKALGECINLTMGQSPPGSTYNERSEGLPFFQGNADFGFRYPEKRRYCTAPARIAHPDDTLVSVRAPVGAINMAWEQCCIGRGVAALRHNSGSSSFTYYSAWVLQEEIQQYEHTGTVFGAINKSQFEALQTVEPRSELIEAFDARVGPIDARIRHNISEARNLTFVRDTLLPKLVSGEVQVTRKGAGQIAQRTV